MKTGSLFCVAMLTAVLMTGEASAGKITIKPSADTYMRGGPTYADVSNGGMPTQMLSGSISATENAHLLLRFDLGRLSADWTIDSVTLTTRAYASDAACRSSLTITVYELTAANADWVEGTEREQLSTGGATWKGKTWVGATSTGTAWAGGATGAGTAGTDYIDTALASFTGNPQDIENNTAMKFTSTADFISAVAKNAGGQLNLIISADDTIRNFFKIYSRETTGGQHAAELTITYTIP